MSQCNASYSVLSENLKFFTQFAYLAPGVLFQLRILTVIWGTHHHIYSKNSFFRIWSLDSAASLLQMFLDVSFSRIHIYFPQLCPQFAEFLETYWMIPHIIYPLYLYGFTAKTVIHAFLSINRASCVLMPTRYSHIWSHHMRKVIIFIMLYPFLLLWNVIISEKYLDYIFGGFVISYIKRVPWASLSRFQLTSFFFTFSITLISTGITLSKMCKLKKRLITGERHLCIATSWITVGFAIAMIAQAHFAWFRGDHEWAQVFYIVQCVSFDILNFG
ncbi:CRE-SRG-4 protein [Caenorhabditis remanei]|uniref:Serpentine receptor class gamma n=1 Tax=Caenorhabditis remanei TaxID=31234 RepID=E3LWS9_CAERE|nr:CRE-SRG-4 protein [Caenorhabditis remanei]